MLPESQLSEKRYNSWWVQEVLTRFSRSARVKQMEYMLRRTTSLNDQIVTLANGYTQRNLLRIPSGEVKWAPTDNGVTIWIEGRTIGMGYIFVGLNSQKTAVQGLVIAVNGNSYSLQMSEDKQPKYEIDPHTLTYADLQQTLILVEMVEAALTYP